MTKKQKKMLIRILITAVMLIALKFIPITGIPQLIAYLAAYLVIGYDILKKAGKGILNGRAFDENFLMALATLGAFGLAIWTKSGDYVEGIAVMLRETIKQMGFDADSIVPPPAVMKAKMAEQQLMQMQQMQMAQMQQMQGQPQAGGSPAAPDNQTDKRRLEDGSPQINTKAAKLPNQVN